MFLKTIWKPLRSKAEKIDSLIKISNAFLATHSKSRKLHVVCFYNFQILAEITEVLQKEFSIMPAFTSMYPLHWSHSKFWNKMYPFARGSRVEASTIGIISIGWADFRLILVSRAPTYCNHADILYSCNARSSTLNVPLSSCYSIHRSFPPPPLFHPRGHPPSVSFFAFVHFPRLLPGTINALLSYR